MANVKEEVIVLLNKYKELTDQIKTLRGWEASQQKEVLTIIREAPEALRRLTGKLSNILWPETERITPEQDLNTLIIELGKQENLLVFGFLQMGFVLTRLRSFITALNSLLKPTTIPKRTIALINEVQIRADSLDQDSTKLFARINNLPSKDNPAEYVKKTIKITSESQEEFLRAGENMEALMIILPKFLETAENILQKLAPQQYAQIAAKIN